MRSIPRWKEGDKVWLQTRIAKTTVASQLAQDTADKKKCTWQEIIPEQYHLLQSGSAPILFHIFLLPFQSHDLMSHGPSPDLSPEFHHMTVLLF